MALLALPRRSLVEHGGTSLDHAALVMAHLAWNFVMRAIELKSGMNTVIEFGGPPAENRVAAVTSFFVRVVAELAAVNVGMAARAVSRRAMERYTAD